MPLLKDEPPDAVKSLDELFAIAFAMEREAATRYADIAERMRHEGNPDLAQVFEHLSADELGHIDNVIAWSRKTKGQEPDVTSIRWEIPETFDDEGAGITDPRLLSAYGALAMAVRNEERAFAFWSYVAAHAESAEIRQAAEAMAHEELGHVSLLRRERRKAFHAERSKSGSIPRTRIEGPDLAALERRLADLLEPLAAQALPGMRARLLDLVREARRHADELEHFSVTISRAVPSGPASDDPLALAELLTDSYLEAGDNLRDEQMLGRMQAFAGSAITRLAWLRADLPELHEP